MTPHNRAEQQIRIASKLYEARDAARSLLGDRYAERVGEVRAVIRGLASAEKINTLSAALNLGQRVAEVDDGYTLMLVMAAACEEAESSS
jgi:hypothetical protein